MFHVVGADCGQTPTRHDGPSAGGLETHAGALSWPLHCRHAPSVPAHAPAGFMNVVAAAANDHVCAAEPGTHALSCSGAL